MKKVDFRKATKEQLMIIICEEVCSSQYKLSAFEELCNRK